MFPLVPFPLQSKPFTRALQGRSSLEKSEVFRALFDRTAEHAEVAVQLNVFLGEIGRLKEVEGRSSLMWMRR